jgi:hypothetical protein
MHFIMPEICRSEKPFRFWNVCAFVDDRIEERAMIKPRRHFKQQTTLQDRIVEWAAGVREQADELEPGPQRDELLRKLQRALTAMHLEDWANSAVTPK